ncbi:MAG: hypothetical protein NTAFB05_09930 [Nitrobacter sp.]
MFDLTGRTALVTGATGGIGGAIAKALHAQGATVAISGTRREVLETLAGTLGERAYVLPCNLSNTAEVEALVPEAEKAMGQVDILVANAGITRDNLFVQLRDEDWDDVIRVNLTATFRLARAATKLMMRKRFGRIIAITSRLRGRTLARGILGACGCGKSEHRRHGAAAADARSCHAEGGSGRRRRDGGVAGSRLRRCRGGCRGSRAGAGLSGRER